MIGVAVLVRELVLHLNHQGVKKGNSHRFFCNDYIDLRVFERFLCMLVFLGIALTIPSFPARSKNFFTSFESRCQCFF